MGTPQMGKSCDACGQLAQNLIHLATAVIGVCPNHLVDVLALFKDQDIEITNIEKTKEQ